jgi:hypothetical protein
MSDADIARADTLVNGPAIGASGTHRDPEAKNPVGAIGTHREPPVEEPICASGTHSGANGTLVGAFGTHTVGANGTPHWRDWHR